MLRRPAGGVSITLMSRREARPICMVRGMGVAVSVSTSTEVLYSLMRSLCLTPKRCSSSTTTSPRSLGLTSDPSSACVPTSTSTSPARKSAKILRRSAGRVKRERLSTLTAWEPSLSLKVRSCCCTRMVVGASIMVCLPARAALNAARTDTSVLPKPTSPQIRRSIGCGLCISVLTAELAGERLDPLSDPVRNLRPRRATEFVEARAVAPHILVQQLHLLVWHEERVASTVAHLHVVAGGTEDFLGHQPLEASDTLHGVHDKVPDLQVSEGGERPATRTPSRLSPAAEQRVPPEDRNPAFGIGEPLLDLPRKSVETWWQIGVDPRGLAHGAVDLPESVNRPPRLPA